MITVGIISPKISLHAIDQVIDHRDFGCVFRKYIYDKLEDIADIYENCKSLCDVIFCSGELGYYQLMKIEDLKIPCTFVSYEEKHILSIFLNFVISHPDIPLNRVYCDFLTPMNDFMGLNQYLPADAMPHCFESTNYVYEELIERAKKLWNSGKIDIMLTRCTNIIDTFETLNIPYIHLLPTEAMISESIQNAVDNARLQAPEYRVCTILRLIYPDHSGIQDQEYLDITMYRYILEFRKQQELNLSISRSYGRFEITGDSSDLEKSTRQVQSFLAYLTQLGDLEFRMGVGISKTPDESHFQAETALQESIRFGKNDGFLMFGKSSDITGPLSMAPNLSYSYHNQQAVDYAQEKGINESNLLKIVGLFRRNDQEILTASGLSKWLNITPRSCNRIISQLLESQLIREINSLKADGKGRPSRQYCFVKENCEKAFFGNIS